MVVAPVTSSAPVCVTAPAAFTVRVPPTVVPPNVVAPAFVVRAAVSVPETPRVPAVRTVSPVVVSAAVRAFLSVIRVAAAVTPTGLRKSFPASSRVTACPTALMVVAPVTSSAPVCVTAPVALTVSAPPTVVAPKFVAPAFVVRPAVPLPETLFRLMVPEPLEMVALSVRVTGEPRVIGESVAASRPARLITLGALAVRPPVKVRVSVAAAPRVNVPVLLKVVAVSIWLAVPSSLRL